MQKIAKGYVAGSYGWELAEFAGREDIDIVEGNFIRQELPNGKQVKVYFYLITHHAPLWLMGGWLRKADPTYLEKITAPIWW